MGIEYLGEKIFLEEISSSGQVWVARSIHNNIHTMELDRTGLSLPVWSSSERVTAYLNNARLIGPEYQPHAIAVDRFSDSWLSNKMLAITELLINPDGRSSRMLALYPEEFQDYQIA